MTLIDLLTQTNKGAPNNLIVGQSSKLNDLIVAEVLSENTENEYEKVTVDIEQEGIDELIADLSESSLFGEKKIIIVKNPIFLSGKNSTIEKSKIDELVKIFEHVGALSDQVIFVAEYEKLDSRKKITKIIQKNFNVIKSEVEPKLFPKLSENFLAANNYQIATDALKLLISRSNNNTDDLLANIEKLISAAQGKSINYELVDQQIEQGLEENIFAILDKTLTGDYQQALAQLDDQLKKGVDPIAIVGILISQMTLFFQVKNLAKINDADLAKLLKIHPYRIKLARQKKIPVKTTDIALKKLIELDYRYKSGQIRGAQFLIATILSI